ncbi:hypothetical protein S7711_03968 [Stachybotrys chartarum IBT 7711]|uniref:Rad4 beta-hairpin domain-containing protein n=1 Tax=Stachybotrys chartarum (strain CBS 109288 / IBT 7711) TaxID=1280523 RepID=A0A084AQY6_STACB|nr:hypothetical protein S7711_03968 [Stachybotrys chartarum IBT 7711]
MAGRKRNAAAALRNNSANGGSGIYQTMLAEAGVAVQAAETPERPLKRRRPGSSLKERKQHQDTEVGPSSSSPARKSSKDAEEEDEVEFEDVLPVPNVQTMERDTDDEDDEDEDEDIEFEDIDFQAVMKDTGSAPERPKELTLNLTTQKSATTLGKRGADRRKPLSKEDRQRRVEIHKAHLLCLLSHVARRNHWCNDAQVQDSLRPHLTDKMVKYLTPGTNLSQFGRAESLKNGLQQALVMWRTKFEITERGLRRARWAEEVEHLANYQPPDDMDSVLDRVEFREAAKKLQGSRDVGAQLFCAMLRSIGVRARLVCSLQPLPSGSGGPTLPKPTKGNNQLPTPKPEPSRKPVAQVQEVPTPSSSSRTTARRRLGHPNAAAHRFEPPPVSHAKPRPIFEAPKHIRESAYPVYWVEILDVGHQKWQPVDAVVTHTFWKPKSLEPPITDKENCLSYVIAFNQDGTAKDVTRRYAKAYTAKTRKLRIDGQDAASEPWWRKTMRYFRPRRPTDLDQIEDIELQSIESREPMPRNVHDFKDHPIYALERHLRRNEVLVPDATPSGTVGAGSRGPLEKIYRRRDVRVARSADKWYRMGREVKPNEIPAKWLPKRAKPSNFDDEDDGQGDAGTPVYTEDQTEAYQPPPVRDGKVPKNKFGNIDVYVPSMVPAGGVHIVHEHATRAAFLLGIDYAPALTGFDFKGRHGTAVLTGIVVAKENEEGVRAVIDSLGDLEREVADERRRLAALRMWRRLLMGLRIRERIWSGVDTAEREDADREAELEAEIGDAPSDVTEEFDMEDDGGGGFLVE